MARAINWIDDTLKAQGLADREIARQWESLGILHREKQKREGTPSVHKPSTPAIRARNTPAHRGTPGASISGNTGAHLSTPLPHELVRRLALLPTLETLVAREQDRQRRLSTPIGTPRHTAKKTDVVDTLYIDLIERYAQAEGVELKDVVNLEFHEFFERRQYLPAEG